MTDDFYWACSRDSRPAGHRFLIANGKDILRRRVYSEIDKKEICFSHRIHQGNGTVELSDIISLLICQVPTYQINHNKFLLEAAQIPIFAEYLYTHGQLASLISNPVFDEFPIHQEPYDEKAAHRLAKRVELTLNKEFDDFL